MHALSEFTTLRLGGPPRHLVEAGDEDALVRAVRQADVEHSPVLVFGGGSNIVVADDGFPGTVVRVLSSGVYKHREGDSWILHVQAGESWDALVSRSVRAGLAGFECLSGIPGSVGATPIQNVGAYGQEVSETIVSVRVYDREQDVVCELNPLECEFAYRASIFKRTPSRWVVLGVTFSLPEQPHSRPIRYTELARALQVRVGDSAPLGSVREAVLALRRSKGMVLSEDDPDTRSVGSFFVNPTFSSEEFERLVER
ncbi:MAG TPA: UDP-N-acetylmuramate dehydrogenase, partial [Chloroflexota bacterium]